MTKVNIALMTATALLLLSADANATRAWQELHAQGAMHFIAIDKAEVLNMDVYRDAVASTCVGKRICLVHFWTDAKKVPHKLPMTDAQASSEVATWTQNLNTGMREWLWNCKVVAKPQEGSCAGN
jgi:hypothetical protein